MTVLDLDDPALDPPSPGRRPALLLLLGIGALLALLVVAVGGVLLVQRGESLPGTRLSGIDVGGLDEADVRARVALLVAARRELVVEVRTAEVRETVSAAEVGLAYDAEGTVARVLRAGREDGPVDRVRQELAALAGSRRTVPFDGVLDRGALVGRVERLRAAIDQEPDPGGFAVAVLGAAATATARQPQDGRRLDTAATATLLEDALLGERAGPFVLPVDVSPVSSTPAQVQSATATASAALAQTLRLTAGELAVTLTPVQLAPLVESRVDAAGAVSFGVVESAVTATVTAAAQALDVPARQPRLDTPAPDALLQAKDDASFRPQPVAGVVADQGADGRALDVPAVVAEVTAALRTPRSTGTLAVRPVPATVTGADLARVDQVIGSFTTAYACCAPRARNIARIAQLVDGAVVAPGATFSLNAAAGQRTLERGFVSDGAIVDGELVDQVGGGVSQFSTTMFNAAWFAGLPVLDHKPHSSYISRYPPGREATLDFDTIDQVWRNTTAAPVVVRTATTPTSVTVSLYGHTGDRVVLSDTGPREPRGEGFRVQVDRSVTDAGAVVLRDSTSWTYGPPLT